MKTAFITGGSSGLGLEMAKILAAKGYHSLIMARNQSKIDQATETIRKQGGRASGFAGDITDRESLKKLAQKIKEEFGKIDFLILNAGVAHVKLLSDYENPEGIKEDIEVDLWGTILTAYYTLPLLKPESKILIVSSLVGFWGMAGYASYCSAKAGLISFGESLRRELLCKKISVYMACPADIETPQYQSEFESMPEWMKKQTGSRPAVLSPQVAAERILKQCSGKRFFIFSDFTSRLVFFLSRYLPWGLRTFVLDRMIPYPKEN